MGSARAPLGSIAGARLQLLLPRVLLALLRVALRHALDARLLALRLFLRSLALPALRLFALLFALRCAAQKLLCGAARHGLLHKQGDGDHRSAGPR